MLSLIIFIIRPETYQNLRPRRSRRDAFKGIQGSDLRYLPEAQYRGPSVPVVCHHAPRSLGSDDEVHEGPTEDPRQER